MTVSAAFSPGDYPASDVRRALNAAMLKAGAQVSARDGVIQAPSSPLSVSSAGGMALSVNPGQAMVSQWTVTSDAVESVTVAPSTTSARTDLVVLRVYDSESGDADSHAAVEIVTGVSVAVPATPARSIALAEIAVGANVVSITSANVSDRRTLTTSNGGVLAVPGILASPPSGLIEGQMAWDSIDGSLGVNKAGAWQRSRMSAVPRGPAYIGIAANTGPTATSTGPLGFTNGFTVPAAPFPRLLHIQISGFFASMSVSTAVHTWSIRKNGAETGRRVQGAGTSMIHTAVLIDAVPANTAPVYQGIVQLNTGTAAVTTDARFVHLILNSLGATD